jgi:hypothetical protein
VDGWKSKYANPAADRWKVTIRDGANDLEPFKLDWGPADARLGGQVPVPHVQCLGPVLEEVAVPDAVIEVCEALAHHLDFPPEGAAGSTATVALWAVLSYGYPAWPAVPYLYVGGPMASGESRLFEVLHRIVFRPLSSPDLTGPALFRTLHDRGGDKLPER